MNETLSLIGVTSLLAIGGLGLYMFKSSDVETNQDIKYNEDELFGVNNNDLVEENRIKPRVNNVKTKRNRKGSGTKRRY